MRDARARVVTGPVEHALAIGARYGLARLGDELIAAHARVLGRAVALERERAPLQAAGVVQAAHSRARIEHRLAVLADRPVRTLARVVCRIEHKLTVEREREREREASLSVIR